MVTYSATAQILVIQLWIEDVAPIRTALEQAHIEAEITRVDIEPALYAALSWQHYDFVIYVPTTHTLSLAAVQAALQALHSPAVLIVADDVSALGGRVKAVLDSRRN